MAKTLMILLWGCAAVAAHAEGAPEFLTKDQATEAMAGKAYTYARSGDGARIRWDFKSDGTVYANNRSSTKKNAGEWAVRNNGEVCIKWRGGSNDSCNSYFLKDGQLLRTGGRFDDAASKAVAMTPD